MEQRFDAAQTGDAWRFAQEMLGNPVANPFEIVERSRCEREFQEWLVAVSSVHTKPDPELADWWADVTTVQEFDWDPARHPRRGGPPNAGWFASTGGAGGWGGTGATAGTAKRPGLLDSIIRRNSAVAQISGQFTPELARSNRMASDVSSALQFVRELGPAMGLGLRTGGKAVVSGTATSVKNVATLGLSSSQLELIGVTKEDRERGYDTAVTIATASGEVLITVGTSGLSAALSKGGTVARVAGGSLVAFDAAGNALGVVQGSYDAANNGVSLRSGAQVAAGALGLGANASAAKGLTTAKPTAPPTTAPAKAPAPTKGIADKVASKVVDYVATLPRKVTPTKSAANQYEIKHTGPYNYTISGGGKSFDIDGYRESTVLEAKHVQNPLTSPFVPGASIRTDIREVILDDVRDELTRLGEILKSGSTPFLSVEIITNSKESKSLFEGLLKGAKVPGTVRVED